MVNFVGTRNQTDETEEKTIKSCKVAHLILYYVMNAPFRSCSFCKLLLTTSCRGLCNFESLIHKLKC